MNGTSSTTNSSKINRYAIVGLGSRASFYYSAIVRDFKHSAELVAFCDLNQTRMNLANSRIAEFGAKPVKTYKPDDFDKMVAETKPDFVIVTTIDRVHHKYCIRAMELGCNAIVEKPMTIDEEKLQAMIDAEKRTGKETRVTFNYRYSPHHTKVRELIAEGTIGEVTSVHFEWLLDTAHGGDFFRRWHRIKANSGGLLLSKSIHHFDLVNFWLGADPVSVFALGGLRFYGRENAEARGVTKFYTRTYGNPNAEGDPFALHLEDNEQLRTMYLEAEKEDGYIRDQSVFGEGITIEDTLGLMVKYSNKAILTYSTYAYAPWEGFRVSFNGTKGRIEYNLVESGYKPGAEREHYALGKDASSDKTNPTYVHGGVVSKSIMVLPMFGKPYDVPIPKGIGGHGGGDPLLLEDILGGRKPDRFNRASFIREGAMSTLIGIGGNNSIRTGQVVDVANLVKF